MSYISWGNSINGVRVGVAWRDPASPSPAGGQTVTADIYIDRAVNITDTSNLLQWSGSKLTSGSVSNLNLSGVGQRLIHSVSAAGAVGGNMDIAVTLNGVEYAPGNLNAGQTVWVPYAKPPAPSSGSVTRVSDSRADCSWSGSPTSAAPWESVGVDRRRDDDAWKTVAKLKGSARAWTDTTLEVDRRYRYAVWASNSAESSSSRDLGYIYTSPLAATMPTWTKTATGDVALSWLVRARWGAKQWAEESTDGGSTWAKRSPDLSATATAWTHGSPSTAVQHLYRIVTETPNGLQSRSPASTPVALLAPPNKPTSLTPDAVAALGEPIVITWRHNPVDGSPQTAFEVRRRPDAAAGWTSTGKTASPTSRLELPDGTYTSGRPEYQVRTWGQHADPSDWSDLASFAMAHRPVGGLTVPDGSGSWDSSTLPMGGSYFDADGTPLSAWRATLSGGGGADRVWSGAVEPISAIIDGLTSATTYTLTLEVRSGVGLWSAPDVRTFTVTYAPPELPDVEVSFVRGQAAAIITITNPATGVAVVRNEAYNGDGQLLGEVGPNGSIIWRLPDLDGTARVMVRAITASPSSVDTGYILVPIPRGDLGVHLNAGPGLSLHAALWGGSPQIGWKADVETSAVRYAGDRKESVTYGDGEPFTLSLSGAVRFSDEDSSRAAWERVIRARTVVCYRDPARTLYGYLDGPGITESTTMRHGNLSLTFVETDYDDADISDRSVAVIEDPPNSGEYRIMLPPADMSLTDLLR